MLKAILFDMDGTLLDSEIHYMQGTYKWMKEKGFKGSQNDLFCLIGLTMDKTHEKLAALLDHRYSVEEVEAFNYDYFMHADPLPFERLIFEDVKRNLQALKEMGLKIGLCSMSEYREINQFIEKNGLQFDVVVSGDDCHLNKPNPEIYLKALDALNIKAEEAIVVEDSTNGILAGKNAKIKTVGRKDTRFHIDQSQADHLFDNLDDFVLWVKEKQYESSH